MPEVNPKVMKMVEDRLKENKKTPNKELKEAAEKIDPSIKKLDSRQFNGRYTLQVKRRMAPKRGRPSGNGRRRGAATQGADRSAIRGIMLEFAKEIAGSEDMVDVVEVIGGVDRYVDRVVKAAGAK